MSDEQLMKQCNDHADLLAMVDKEVKPQQSTLPSQQLLRKAAEAIERLEADVKRLLEDAPGALIKEALSERMRTADAEARAEKAERELADKKRVLLRRGQENNEIREKWAVTEEQLAEARAEIERLQSVLRETKDLLEKAYQDAYVVTAKTGIFMALTTPAPEPHDPKTGPCPTCGFQVRRVERQPFNIEDDEPTTEREADYLPESGWFDD